MVIEAWIIKIHVGRVKVAGLLDGADVSAKVALAQWSAFDHADDLIRRYLARAFDVRAQKVTQYLLSCE